MRSRTSWPLLRDLASGSGRQAPVVLKPEVWRLNSETSPTEKLQRDEQKHRDQDRATVQHVAAKTWHLYASAFGNGSHHKIGSVPDVGQRAHEARSCADCRQNHVGDSDDLGWKVLSLSERQERE